MNNELSCQIVSHSTQIKFNVYNNKWFIEFVRKSKFWQTSGSPVYVYESVPYVSPDGTRFNLVKYFDTAQQAQAYVNTNLHSHEVSSGEISDAASNITGNVGIAA